MGYTEQLIEAIRSQTQAADTPLEEARARRDDVLSAAGSFPGALRDFSSGSLAHFTVIKPVSDADCGLVLDRRAYPSLGPDGDNVGPREVVDAVIDTMAPRLRAAYPHVQLVAQKRAILVTFAEPVTDEEDPSVDLVVCLTRKDEPGLWIPHLHQNDWDASDPERHTELFTEGADALRRVRRRAVRIAKAWNKQYPKPALSSFNLEAVALAAVENDMSIVQALLAVFSHGASQLAKAETPDPAGVSMPIRCDDRALAVRRLQTGADGIAEALEHNDDEAKVRQALSKVFFAFVDAPDESSKAGYAASVRRSAAAVTTGGLTRPTRPTRSHGETR